ncbi:class IV lanthionine synthetase LanL [Streptomyces triculaminicus]|uniref:class IV lanthionine synthetase LanL n=1 Tax=Streptomyces triculaminicus TaxID=2816232 RepID=UPI0037D13DBD
MTVSPQASYQSIAARILGAERPSWTMRDGEAWCMITPPGYRTRRQGWKLHVSATVVSAHEVLERAAGVLVAHGCAFKFAVSPSVTADLTGARAARAHSGKFLTAYPADDDQLRLLAEELHRATAGLAGPVILSDRRYRPGSLVHYRYGCFSAPRELDDEGFYRGRLQAPDGTLVTDERNPWFSPPAWARPPFDQPARTRAGAGGGPVLLADRYLVREAIRHANRGGVYRAHDRRTGRDVLLKEARPHVGARPDGTDARDWLRYEAGVLAHLAPLGIAPAPHGVFEAGGHTFLAEDLIDGENLHQWSADGALRAGGRLPAPAAWRLARDLTRLVGAAHAAGFVLRDLKPTNVVVRPDGTPVLVDLECAVRADGTAPVMGTQGFTAPEYLSRTEDDGLPPGPEADCFSLGATLLHATADINPLLAPDTSPARPPGERLTAIVEAAAPDCPALRSLAPLVLGLTADPPARWPLEKAAAFLRAEPAEPAISPGPALAGADLDRLLADGLGHIAATADPSAVHLWPRPRTLPEGDPCNLQQGAAGVVAVLDRAVRTGEAPALESLLRTAAHWLDGRLARPARVLPGLYFGRSGTAWALHDAARTLDDPELAARARQYALDIPLGIPLAATKPDICHGLSGAGLAQLHLWHATGDQRFAERASACADGVLCLLAEADGGVDWPLGPSYRSELAGSGSYGFGHGVAGNAAFLLAAGRDLDRPELLDIAIGGGHALCAVAERRGDIAVWPKGPGRTERTGLDFWCNGASGIGTTLVRLWQETGEPRFGEYADLAARTAHRDRWRLGTGTCHGVAGNAQLLLDLGAATGDETYRTRAAEAAACLHTRAALRDGRLVVPDDTLRDFCVSYQVGLAGALDLLLRLKHGGGRSWSVDPGPAAPEGG